MLYSTLQECSYLNISVRWKSFIWSILLWNFSFLTNNTWVRLSIKFLQGALAKPRSSRFVKIQKIIYDLLYFCVDPFIECNIYYIYIYIYIYIVLCIMVAGFIIKGCLKYFLTLDTPLRIVDSWLDFRNKRDFMNDRCQSVKNMHFPYFFVWPLEPLRKAIVGKSIYTCFVAKVCLTYRCSFLKLSVWIWVVVGWVSWSILISILNIHSYDLFICHS